MAKIDIPTIEWMLDNGFKLVDKVLCEEVKIYSESGKVIDTVYQPVSMQVKEGWLIDGEYMEKPWWY
jgi:hypothetical protein